MSKWDISINRGILTGYNEAFIIDEEIKNKLISEDPKSAELIRPILRGKDIKRYSYHFANLYLIFIPWHFPLQNDPSIKGASLKAEEEFKRLYPAIYSYLLSHKDKLSERNKSETGIRYEWYALQRWGSNYWDEFYKQKIMYNDINQRLSFCIVPEGVYCNNTVYFMCPKQHIFFLLAVLNSKVIDWYYKNLSVQLGENTVRMFTIYVNQIPVPKAESSIEIKLTNLVKKYLENKNASIDEEIDKTIYKLYQLNSEEIEFLQSV